MVCGFCVCLPMSPKLLYAHAPNGLRFADTSLAWFSFEMDRARWTCMGHVVGTGSGVC